MKIRFYAEKYLNLHTCDAFSSDAGITLATELCQEKSNDIKVMPLLIGKLDITGHVVTADAMAMQKDIVDAIRKKDADFLIDLRQFFLFVLRNLARKKFCT